MTPQVPPADDVTGEWWDATRDHRLLLQVCTSCHHVQHPPRAICTGCGSTSHLTSRPSAGAGAVDSWTEVHRAPRPGVQVPYVVGRVRLDEGPLLLSRLIGDPAWRIGERLELSWLDLDDGRALPVFERVSAPGPAPGQILTSTERP